MSGEPGADQNVGGASEDGAQMSEPAGRVVEHRPEPHRPTFDLEVAFQNPNHYPEAGARLLRPWLLRLLAQVAMPAVGGAGLSFGVRFVGDRAMRQTNRHFRGFDKSTDVLSFPGEDGVEGRHLGDVLISVPTARRQAAAAGHPVETELQILLLHGVLHCLGYDHETDGGEMERLERRLRRAFAGAAGKGAGDGD
jgi:probable rRNA maturation factor